MEYEQGMDAVLWVTFADYKGTEVNVASGTVTVSHRWGNDTRTDVDRQALANTAGGTFYYIWNIPAAAARTVYDVKYVGTYADGTVGVGDETFYVVPRKFYRTKAGGMIQKTIMPKVWTKKEKDETIEKIDLLEESLGKILGFVKRINIKYYAKDMRKLNDSVSLISKDLSKLDEIKTEVMAGENKTIKAIELIESKPEPKELDFNWLKYSLGELKSNLELVENMSEKLDRLGPILLEVDNISKGIKDLKDLKDLKELKELYLRTIPKETLTKSLDVTTIRRLVNGNKRITC